MKFAKICRIKPGPVFPHFLLRSVFSVAAICGFEDGARAAALSECPASRAEIMRGNVKSADSAPCGHASCPAAPSKGDAGWVRGGHERIKVKARTDALARQSEIGGRLGLSLQHNPAMIDVVSHDLMASRGYMKSTDAAAAAPGVTWGGAPGNPSQFVVRGFLSNQINVLRDGIYLGPSTMVTRPFNSFNLDSMQVMQGPASMLYGQGSVGGTIDMVTRKPDLTKRKINLEAGYGSFNSVNAGIGVSTPIAKNLAARIDFSRTASDGYVEGATPHSDDLTASILWAPSDRFRARLGVDYLSDKLSTYYGAPLVPLSVTGHRVGGVLHSANGLGVTRGMLWTNYNIRNPVADSVSAMPTLHMTWQPNHALAFHNKAYFYYAKRRWENAENYSYVAADGITDDAGQPITPGRIGRDRFYVYQNQHQVGDTLNLTYKNRIFSRPNRFVLGGDAYYLRFIRNAGASPTPYTDSVGIDQTNAGAFGPFPGQFPFSKSPATLTDAAIFMEDVWTVLPKLRIIVGARYDWLMVNRQNYRQSGAFDPNSSFSRTFNPFNYRAGLVYDLTDRISLYGVYATGEDPPNGNILRANRNNFTALSHSRQGEIGVKAVSFHGHFETTFALYDIMRTNILVATGQNSIANAGEQTSRGIEWAGHLRLNRHWRFDANLAYTDAHYGAGFQPSPGVDASFKQVPDVPGTTANLWGVWSHPKDLPIEFGAGMQYVSARKGNYTNTLTLNDYALVNIYAAWDVYKNIRLYGRIDNLGDKRFVQWADTSYPSEVIIGTPRAFSFNMQARF